MTKQTTLFRRRQPRHLLQPLLRIDIFLQLRGRATAKYPVYGWRHTCNIEIVKTIPQTLLFYEFQSKKYGILWFFTDGLTFHLHRKAPVSALMDEENLFICPAAASFVCPSSGILFSMFTSSYFSFSFTWLSTLLRSLQHLTARPVAVSG